MFSALALLLTSKVVKGFYFTKSSSAFFAVLTIALLNTFIRPLIFLLTLPFTIITLGLFIFLLNGLMFYLAAEIIDGFEIESFLSAVFGSLVFSLIQFFISSLFF
jgi:putative membrane protein